jgi:hypothetical protein
MDLDGGTLLGVAVKRTKHQQTKGVTDVVNKVLTARTVSVLRTRSAQHEAF